MSKTQQEIAAPKARKIYQIVSITLLSMSLTAAFIFFIYARQTDMFTFRIAQASALTVILSMVLLASVIACIMLKAAKNAAVFGFFAVILLVMLLIQEAVDRKKFTIVGTFNSSVLFLLVSTILFLSLSILAATRLKRHNFMVVTALNCVVFSVSMMFCGAIRYYTQGILTVAAFVCITSALMCVIACFAARDKRIITTKWITYCATFTALSIVLKIMGNALTFAEVIKFSIVYIPWVISGIVLGPVGGMITACVGDVLGQLILPSGFGINPIITLANTLFPLFPALMYKYSRINQKWLSLLIGMAVSAVVCTLFLSTFGQWLYNTDIPFWTRVWGRILQPVVIAVNYVMIVGILPALNRAKLTNLRFIKT